MLISKNELENKNDDELFNMNYNYQLSDDEELQEKMYKKRELYYYKYEDQPELTSDDEIKEYRKEACKKTIDLRNYQLLLSNFINPETPYKGLVIFHGTGTGKTCIAINIAEGFIKMVQQYGTKILVLVPGPLIGESWKRQFLTCTKNKYINNDELLNCDATTKEKLVKKGITNALQNYKVMSFTSFVKKTLGNKISEHKNGKLEYLKKDGEYVRELTVDTMQNLDNTLCIVDEAHQLTGNDRGKALIKMIKKSINLKILLLTATPMKNMADDIVELINYLRPQTSQMKKNKIFDYDYNSLKIKEGGLEYLKKMSNGYVSYLRGRDPLTYAIGVDKGKKHPELLFTKVINSKMLNFQEMTYQNMIKTIGDSDKLHKKKEALSNFVFPVLNADKSEIIGNYGKEGMHFLINQLKMQSKLLNEKVAKDILNIKDYDGDEKFIYLSENKKELRGKIFSEEYLENFSSKFYNTLKNLNELVYGQKGLKTAFIYSNLVKVGIKLFQTVMLHNGYLEYNEDNVYDIKSNTLCYYCGKKYHTHSDLDKNIPFHDFGPAIILTITGKSAGDENDMIKEKYMGILENVYNSESNVNGNRLKFVLGSKVLNEGINFKNVQEVHILDVHFTLGRVYQVIGRAIRGCSHIKIMENVMFPEVNIYRYVIIDSKGTSSEIELYKNAEIKELVIKKVERSLKEIAIDCPLNYTGNVFKSEVQTYKSCKMPTKDLTEEDQICPDICDYMNCVYKCADNKLNLEYYDPENLLYKKISSNKLDYSTFNETFIKAEVDIIKEKIKEMYLFKYAYTLKDIITFVKTIYTNNKQDLFNDFFVYKALNALMPYGVNELVNFKDMIYDKFNNRGYLIFAKKYYIFQPFDDNFDQQNFNLPMYYRTNNLKNVFNVDLNLMDFMKIKYNKNQLQHNKTNEIVEYSIDKSYYDARDEFDFIGIIDIVYNKKNETNMEVFKFRKKRDKIVEKKRLSGLQSFIGANCLTTKSKNELENIVDILNKKIGIKTKNISNKTYDDSKISLCGKIKELLMFLEKYSVGKNKMTYIMIPSNYPKYVFPYNLEDRLEKIKQKLFILVDEKYIKINNIQKNIHNKNIITSYSISIKKTDLDNNIKKELTNIGFNKKFEFVVE